MKDYLDEKTRIVLKFHLSALSYVLALQRKKRCGWKTVSWIYPSLVETESCQYIRKWLEWREKEREKEERREGETEKKIGKRLMTVYKGKF